MSHEIELCFFCEIRNKDGLEQANAVEQHEQWEFKAPNDANGRCRGRERVRKTTMNDITKYDLTTKAPKPGRQRGDYETPIEITEAFFENWKRAFAVAGQYKTRYTFVTSEVKITSDGNECIVPELKFEVDIFLDKAGKRSKFAKVDIEIQDVLEHIKKHHPEIDAAKFVIDFTKLPLDIGIIIPAESDDPANQAQVKEFFEYFAIPYQES